MYTQDCVLGYSQPELSKLAGRYGFSACILLKRLRRAGAHEIRLPEDFRSTHPSPTTLHGSANSHFVIPSEAEFPATLLRDTSTCAVFRRRKPHEARRRHQYQQEIRQAEGPAVRLGVKQRPSLLRHCNVHRWKMSREGRA